MKSAADWDARYAAAEGGLFGEGPCPWLAMMVAGRGLSPATALLPADGDGRNGTWLAARGTAVTAVELSGEATRRALARDRAAGIAAERITADLAAWRPPAGRRWEMVAILFLHGPPALRARVVRMGAGTLAPGGWLLVEGFAKDRADGDPGPSDTGKLYDLAELADWTAGLVPVEAMTGRARLDEGPRHRGEATLVRFAARREGGSVSPPRSA